MDYLGLRYNHHFLPSVTVISCLSPMSIPSKLVSFLNLCNNLCYERPRGLLPSGWYTLTTSLIILSYAFHALPTQLNLLLFSVPSISKSSLFLNSWLVLYLYSLVIWVFLGPNICHKTLHPNTPKLFSSVCVVAQFYTHITLCGWSWPYLVIFAMCIYLLYI